MSKTKRPKRDGELDQYFTRDDVARACVKMLPIRPGEAVLEPHAGGGAFLRALAPLNVQLYAYDLDLSCRDKWGVAVEGTWQGNFLDDELDGDDYVFDWIVGNPPYNEAEAHVRRALQLAPNVAFLLRAGLMTPLKREALRREFPVDEFHLLAPRPPFGDTMSVDGTEYALHVWRQEWRRRHPNHERTFSIIEWRGQ